MAISASTLCLAHCLALPVLASTLPALGLIAAHDELVHWLLLSLAAPLAFWALSRGRHRAGPWPRRIGVAGLALMTTALALFAATAAERWLTLAGVLLLAGAHVANWRAGRRACAAAA